jgi:2-amino-4-hydroxy-6-hydroxymethyldihydropteridine diphosphokinase
MPDCLIGIGSNLGDRQRNIREALDRLSKHPQVKTIGCSSLHSTLPVGGPSGQGEFLNAAAVVQTELEPLALLALLHEIENDLGRTREIVWGPRTIDLDLLLYGDAVIDLPTLKVPHPLMTERRFVLEPASEIAAEMVHPQLLRNIVQLLQDLNEREKTDPQ